MAMRTRLVTTISGWAAAAALLAAAWASRQDWHTDEMGHWTFTVLPTLLTAVALVDLVTGIVMARRAARIAWPSFVLSIAFSGAALWYHFTIG